MARMWGSDENWKPIGSPINIPEMSPFPHEHRNYSACDVIRRRMLAAMELKKQGFEHAVMEPSHGDDLIHIPLSKLVI